MKKLLMLGLAVVLFAACQQQQKKRYFSESPEIETIKASISDYNNGDWESWKAHFADTAKLYVNSLKSIGAVDLENAQKELLSNFSSFGFQDKGTFIEMVIDKDDETWVNYWANWHAKFKTTDKEIDVPVHFTAQFVDGKIVELHDYFDVSALNNEIAALANMSADEKLIATNVNKIAQAWIKSDMDSFNTLTVENLGRSVNGVQLVKSQKEYNDLIASNHAMLSDINIVTSDMFIKDNKAYFKWTFSGKNTKDIEGMKATNKPVSINGIAIWSFNNDGKATYEEVYFDQNDVNIQLGYTLTPPN